ncbi:hypothetical protein GLOIN_2v1780194 [Rhizophagus irregularis DAOM 181602=DAOM 197198]|uniref:Uncharacterized protein n=1 Tax=Rhizophagus irregularis (strain DAOM 181602 / DAOM 197198 / MUCL 43194) TaxID=747089 RepID=U9TL86_RHIID|nr:hypothetical protein GLOIN_2v1780194 [Rhizophagus irregularis DAOM 181602=DAOM 197198]
MVKSNQIYENLQSVKELRKLLMEYNKKFSTPILRGIASLSMASMETNTLNIELSIQGVSTFNAKPGSLKGKNKKS